MYNILKWFQVLQCNYLLFCKFNTVLGQTDTYISTYQDIQIHIDRYILIKIYRYICIYRYIHGYMDNLYLYIPIYTHLCISLHFNQHYKVKICLHIFLEKNIFTTKQKPQFSTVIFHIIISAGFILLSNSDVID